MLGEASILFFDPEVPSERVFIIDIWAMSSGGRVLLCTDGPIEYYFTQVSLSRPWMHVTLDRDGMRSTHLAWLLPDMKEITDTPIVSAYLNATGG